MHDEKNLPPSTEPTGPTAAGISRRQFLTGVAATGALALSGGHSLVQAAGELPRPRDSGIRHIVVVMMENRSFDHYFGWVPGADGIQAGMSYLDGGGTEHATHALGREWRGCGHPDPDHGFDGGRIAYNGGACDGWLLNPRNDPFAIGYYQQENLGFFGKAVPQWTTFDRYFGAILAQTYPNRIYQHAAQTDRIHNALTVCRLPTIWDRLAEAGVSARYYYSDLPMLALWAGKYREISGRFPDFLRACSTGRLPKVSFVEPRFLGQSTGASCDDHPHSDIRNGQYFLNQVYKAVTTGPAWDKTVLVINYDEWGGFYDHVPPPTAPIPDADLEAGNTDGLLGFRVPCLLVAPWARRGFVSHRQFDHTSILKMIEWRWRLDPLTVRDETANNLAEALNFDQPLRTPPQFRVRQPPAAGCPEVAFDSSHDFWELGRLAEEHGWPV